MEQLVESLEYNRIPVQMVCWDATLWCGFSSFAPDSGLPIVEYYGFFNMTTFEHDYRYLYVPVKKA